MYYAKQAHDEYSKTLSEARVGINMIDEEFNKLNKIVSTGLKNGQHLYHILAANEIKQSVSTVYRYVSKNLLSAGKMDCPRIVKFKPRKSKPTEYIPKRLKIGRTYDDFCLYRAETNTAAWIEMDTVIGRIGGKCLLTLHFTDSNFMVARLLDYKTSMEVTDKLGAIKAKLPDIFPVILTDNGGEFSNVLEIEKGGTRLFFADPYQSCQKARVEKNHTMFRDIVPSGSSFDNFTQETVDLIFSHVNSVKRAHFSGKSAYEMFTFLHKDKTATALGIVEIQPGEVVQSPKLLKNLRSN
jgi:IS30 family transposase